MLGRLDAPSPRSNRAGRQHDAGRATGGRRVSPRTGQRPAVTRPRRRPQEECFERCHRRPRGLAAGQARSPRPRGRPAACPTCPRHAAGPSRSAPAATAGQASWRCRRRG